MVIISLTPYGAILSVRPEHRLLDGEAVDRHTADLLHPFHSCFLYLFPDHMDFQDRFLLGNLNNQIDSILLAYTPDVDRSDPFNPFYGKAGLHGLINDLSTRRRSKTSMPMTTTSEVTKSLKE